MNLVIRTMTPAETREKLKLVPNTSNVHANKKKCRSYWHWSNWSRLDY